MSPLLQLQSDVFGLLMSSDKLKHVNIVMWRKFRVASEVQWDTLWTTVRNGRSGAGILIWMPTLKTEYQNLPAGERVLLSVSIVEEPNLNVTPETGTLIVAEDLAFMVKDLIHALCVDGMAEIVSASKALDEDPDFEGVLAYKLNFELVITRAKDDRCAPPVLSQDDESRVVLTNGTATPDAEIWFTIDGSYPSTGLARDPVTGARINPESQRYALPLIVPDYTSIRLRWVAYQVGFDNSHVSQFEVTDDPETPGQLHAEGQTIYAHGQPIFANTSYP